MEEEASFVRIDPRSLRRGGRNLAHPSAKVCYHVSKSRWGTHSESVPAYWLTPEAWAKPVACDEGMLLAGAGGVKEAPSALIAPE